MTSAIEKNKAEDGNRKKWESQVFSQKVTEKPWL